MRRALARLFATVSLAVAFATGANAVTLNFCWRGAAGYTLTGQMTFPDALRDARRITEDDVTGFAITGYLDGLRIGSWDMRSRGPTTTWHLRFSPATMTFPTGGSFRGEASQGWNANGDVDDCGAQGFGFNSGNYAQDVCLSDVYIEQSSIDPATPLRATAGPVTPACDSVPLMGKRDR